MVPQHFGDLTVNRSTRRWPSGWAVILLAAAAMSLTGCGRKGGLDQPPYASAQPGAAAEVAERPTSKPGTLFDPSYGMDQAPVAAKGRKKPFVLDPLLND
jgi:predicted small lipoprotein YifL